MERWISRVYRLLILSCSFCNLLTPQGTLFRPNTKTFVATSVTLCQYVMESYTSRKKLKGVTFPMVPSTSLSLKLCGSYHAFNFGMSIWKKNLKWTFSVPFKLNYRLIIPFSAIKYLVKCSNWKKNYDEKYSPYIGRSEHSEAWPVHFLTTIPDWITEAPVFRN